MTEVMTPLLITMVFRSSCSVVRYWFIVNTIYIYYGIREERQLLKLSGLENTRIEFVLRFRITVYSWLTILFKIISHSNISLWSLRLRRLMCVYHLPRCLVLANKVYNILGRYTDVWRFSSARIHQSERFKGIAICKPWLFSLPVSHDAQHRDV